MNDKDFVLDTLRRAGLAVAQNVQEQAAGMSGTELNAAADYIPDFQAAKATHFPNHQKHGLKALISSYLSIVSFIFQALY